MVTLHDESIKSKAFDDGMKHHHEMIYAKKENILEIVHKYWELGDEVGLYVEILKELGIYETSKPL